MSIQELPEDGTWEDIQERINFVAGVRVKVFVNSMKVKVFPVRGSGRSSLNGFQADLVSHGKIRSQEHYGLHRRGQ